MCYFTKSNDDEEGEGFIPQRAALDECRWQKLNFKVPNYFEFWNLWSHYVGDWMEAVFDFQILSMEILTNEYSKFRPQQWFCFQASKYKKNIYRMISGNPCRIKLIIDPIFSCGLLSVVNFIDLNNKNGKEGFPCFVLLKTNFLIGFCEERNSYIWVWWVATQPPALLPQGLRSWNFATLWSCNWTRRGWYYWCASAMEMSQQSDLRKKQGAEQSTQSSGNICQKLRQGGAVHPKKKKYVDHLSRLILCGEETIILCCCQ